MAITRYSHMYMPVPFEDFCLRKKKRADNKSILIWILLQLTKHLFGILYPKHEIQPEEAPMSHSYATNYQKKNIFKGKIYNFRQVRKPRQDRPAFLLEIRTGGRVRDYVRIFPHKRRHCTDSNKISFYSGFFISCQSGILFTTRISVFIFFSVLLI